MPRLMLMDEYWSKLKSIMLKFSIYDKRELRLTVEGILYRMRVGCPWRDLPKEFGPWNKVFKRFNDWSKKEKLFNIFHSIVQDPDFEWKFIDGTVVKAHQHRAGAAKNEEKAIGKSVAGSSSKIHLITDAFGLPVNFEITEGQVHDSQIACKLISKLPTGGIIIADKGYDDCFIRGHIKARKSEPIIPKRKFLKDKIVNENIDWGLYKHRHLIENTFARLKHFRSIATRFDKLKRNYEGMLYFACSFLWLPL